MRTMTIPQIHDKALELMDKHNLLDCGWHFDFDNAKRRFGQCDFDRKRITLSKFTIEHVSSDDDIIDTILHEIAHAIVGIGHGHDRVWKAKAREIGAIPNRCGSRKIKDRSKINYKWTGTCPNGHKVYRHKLSRVIKNGSSCNKCCPGRYNKEFQIDWKQNY